jgi:hypothetical protein
MTDLHWAAMIASCIYGLLFFGGEHSPLWASKLYRKVYTYLFK